MILLLIIINIIILIISSIAMLSSTSIGIAKNSIRQEIKNKLNKLTIQTDVLKKLYWE